MALSLIMGETALKFCVGISDSYFYKYIEFCIMEFIQIKYCFVEFNKIEVEIVLETEN